MHRSTLPRPSLVLLLLGLSLSAASQTIVHKCLHEGLTTYSDHLCQQAGTLSTPPLPTVPAFKPLPPAASAPARAPREAVASTTAAAATQRKRCALLAQQRRWALEDVQAARSMAQPPGASKAEQAQRKLRRMEERYRLQCAAP